MVVIPVGQSQYPLLIILPFVRRFGIIDNQRSTKTIRVLGNLVRVIPVCTRLIDLRRILSFFLECEVLSTYREVVCESTSWRNGTLCGAYRAIHLCTTVLIDAVEM